MNMSEISVFSTNKLQTVNVRDNAQTGLVLSFTSYELIKDLLKTHQPTDLIGKQFLFTLNSDNMVIEVTEANKDSVKIRCFYGKASSCFVDISES